VRRLRSTLFPVSAVAVSAAVVVILGFAVVAVAAPDAGAKARGQYNFSGSSAHNSFSSARGHVDNYQRYLNEAHGVPLPAAAALPAAEAAAPARPAQPVASTQPATVTQVVDRGSVDHEIAREASDAIADDIERIQKHVNRMKAQAKSRGDDKALTELADVDKQLGVARRGHAALHDHHAGETITPATAMDLAQQVNAALRTAHAEHDEVMKQLGAAAAP
jgi:hypothetical protein